MQTEVYIPTFKDILSICQAPPQLVIPRMGGDFLASPMLTLMHMISRMVRGLRQKCVTGTKQPVNSEVCIYTTGKRVE